jgi:DNA-binding MarR family transcriptional regulator
VPQTSAAQTSAAQLAGLVRLAVLRLNRTLRANPADAVVTPAARAALGTVARHGPMSPGELARRENVRPPAISAVLASLERQQLIVRRPHPTDGRQSVVELTPAGAALVEEIRDREAWLASRIRELSERDRHTLLRALTIVEKLTQR